MNLYIVRHADAQPIGTKGITTDAERPLSPEGHRQTAQLAALIQRAGVVLDKIVASPLVRAQQTAEVLVHHLQLPHLKVMTSECLEPGQKTKRITKFILGLDAENLALVGHEPDLSGLTAWLIGSKKARLTMAKAGIAHVSIDHPPGKGTGVLMWLITPATYPAAAEPTRPDAKASAPRQS
jgi:phosphohistidine phosphatase